MQPNGKPREPRKPRLSKNISRNEERPRFIGARAPCGRPDQGVRLACRLRGYKGPVVVSYDPHYAAANVFRNSAILSNAAESIGIGLPSFDHTKARLAAGSLQQPAMIACSLLFESLLMGQSNESGVQHLQCSFTQSSRRGRKAKTASSINVSKHPG